MKKWMIAIFLVFVSTALLSAEEEQISFDRDGKVWELTKMNLPATDVLRGFPGLVSARLFRSLEGNYSLEVLYLENGKTWRKNVELAASEVEAIRSVVNKSGYRPSGDLPDDVQQGKIQLLTVNTLASIYYGFDIASLLNAGTQPAVFLTAVSAGFFVPFFLLNDTFVTEAQGYTFAIGTWTGIGLAEGINQFIDLSLPRAWWKDLAGLAGGLGGGWLGYQAAEALHIGPGDAILINAYEFGAAFLGLSIVLMAGYEPDPVVAARTAIGVTAGSALSGLALGYGVSKLEHFTTGDAMLVQIGGLFGGWLGMNISMNYPYNPSNNYGVFTSAVASVGGMALTHWLVNGRDYTIGQAGMSTLGSLAGALFGLAIAYFTPGYVDSQKFSWACWLGSVAGFGTMTALFRDEAARMAKDSRKVSLEWNVNPLALGGMVLEKQAPGYVMPVSSLATATLRF